MRKLMFALPIAALLAAPAAISGTKEVQLNEKDQSKFEKAIEGRTAGEPLKCIGRTQQNNLRVIGDKYLVYGSSRNAKTIYVNEPYGGCQDADRHTLVTRRFTSNLCSGEIAEVVDSTTGTFRGSCSFGDFVPYTKNAK